MTEVRMNALERQLQNNEPKCANCKHWDVDVKLPAFGACGRLVAMGAQAPEIAALFAMTTDLTVCSRWEAK